MFEDVDADAGGGPTRRRLNENNIDHEIIPRPDLGKKSLSCVYSSTHIGPYRVFLVLPLLLFLFRYLVIPPLQYPTP